jgi:hypothetical protein
MMRILILDRIGLAKLRLPSPPFGVFALCLLLAAQMLFPQAAYSAGIWGTSGRSPVDHPGSLPEEIPSPSGNVVVKETPDGLALVGKNTTVLEEILSIPTLTEVLWSPHSEALVVNASDGDLGGTWQPFLYSLDANARPTRRDLRRLLAPFIEKFPRCDSFAPANVAAVAWLDDGKELLVVAEVPRHSVCRNSGALEGFRISVAAWRISARLSEAELRRLWGNALGPRLAIARATIQKP